MYVDLWGKIIFLFDPKAHFPVPTHKTTLA